MVTTNHFFDDYPHILNCCVEVNKLINQKLKSTRVADNEVSFDLILPYLFDELKNEEAKRLSFQLRIHREIVDYYNNGKSDVNEFLELLEKNNSVTPVTYRQYKNINETNRTYISNRLIYSYLKSTERVYYRVQLLDRLSLEQHKKNQIIERVKNFSAFILFDDDIYDLENDIASGKNTILTEYLNQGNHLSEGINEMIRLIKNDSTLFDKFTNNFKNIYSYE